MYSKGIPYVSWTEFLDSFPLVIRKKLPASLTNYIVKDQEHPEFISMNDIMPISNMLDTIDADYSVAVQRTLRDMFNDLTRYYSLNSYIFSIEDSEAQDYLVAESFNRLNEYAVNSRPSDPVFNSLPSKLKQIYIGHRINVFETTIDLFLEFRLPITSSVNKVKISIPFNESLEDLPEDFSRIRTYKSPIGQWRNLYTFQMESHNNYIKNRLVSFREPMEDIVNSFKSIKDIKSIAPKSYEVIAGYICRYLKQNYLRSSDYGLYEYQAEILKGGGSHLLDSSEYYYKDLNSLPELFQPLAITQKDLSNPACTSLANVYRTRLMQSNPDELSLQGVINPNLNRSGLGWNLSSDASSRFLPVKIDNEDNAILFEGTHNIISQDVVIKTGRYFLNIDYLPSRTNYVRLVITINDVKTIVDIEPLLDTIDKDIKRLTLEGITDSEGRGYHINEDNVTSVNISVENYVAENNYKGFIITSIDLSRVK